MPRFFMAGANFAGGAALITGADADHIRVLRLQVGDSVVISDGEGTDYECRLTSLGKGAVEAEVLGSHRSPSEPSVFAVVLAGMPKGERSDYTVQKCTEAGAAEICFFLSSRCVCRPAPATFQKKCERWQRIAEEASKQSGRGIIPKVRILSDFGQALDLAAKQELGLFFYETGDDRVGLSRALSGVQPATAAIITGPEGGFDPAEAELARRVGLTVCAMGPRILRCETAPVVALTALMLSTGNLD